MTDPPQKKGMKKMAKFRRKPEEVLASQAEEDGNSRVAQLFRRANRAIQERGESTSVDLFPLYEAFTQGEGDLPEEWLENLEEVDYYVCSVCSYTCEHKPSELCPVCTAKASAFFKVA
jgi:rubrerythrin